MELCKSAMTCADRQMTDELNTLTAQISQMEVNISTLSATVQEMELELYSQRLRQHASIQYISILGTHKKAIEENIKLLKSGMDPIRNMPAEIWAKIIALRVSTTLQAFFTDPSSQVVLFTAL